MRMKLTDWMKREGVERQAFASRIGVTPMALGRYERGERIPEKETMAAIVVETAGAVTPNDFYSDAIADAETARVGS
jgi:transcriptional regulator with XRE-family HTH domain